jgi:hypothetical protein
MTTKHIHVLGIDPGDETGWCWLTVLRSAIFGDDDPSVIEWDYGTFTGPEPGQAIAISRKAREIQSLDYKTGPAIVSEQWDIDPSFKSTDPAVMSPVRINAQLELLAYENRMGDATLHFQSRSLAFHTYTDERLKRLQLYVPGPDHIRSATRHALMLLRRARERRSYALELWPYPPNGMDPAL